KLITTGPYSIVRCPAYTGAWLSYIGFTMFHLLPGSFIRENNCRRIGHRFWIIGRIGICVFLTIRTVSKDEMMKKEFGKEWK
ncbi:hypothetical protein L218DRAFT_841175, partial [Marasmius fiardii PR-910]